MQPFPHMYAVRAKGSVGGKVLLSAAGVADLRATAPREFGGPGEEWSPESLLVAAEASCFILTFRAVARASNLDWTALECDVHGTLERAEGVARFTKMASRARLTVPSTTLAEAAEKALKKTEQTCLIGNSLRAQRELEFDIVHEGLRIITA